MRNISDYKKDSLKNKAANMTFERMAANAMAEDNFCDATHPMESHSIAPPEL